MEETTLVNSLVAGIGVRSTHDPLACKYRIWHSRVRLFSALDSLRFEDKPSDISIMARQIADVHIEMMIDGVTEPTINAVST